MKHKPKNLNIVTNKDISIYLNGKRPIGVLRMFEVQEEKKTGRA